MDEPAMELEDLAKKAHTPTRYGPPPYGPPTYGGRRYVGFMYGDRPGGIRY